MTQAETMEYAIKVPIDMSLINSSRLKIIDIVAEITPTNKQDHIFVLNFGKL